MTTLAINSMPQLIWPVLVLAAIQFGDALICVKPVKFVAECFDGVGWPRRYWPIMPVLKFLSTAGLIAGIWVPFLATATSFGLVVYFVVAISMHVRARDYGRNLFLNATGMLTICVAVAVVEFVRIAPAA